MHQHIRERIQVLQLTFPNHNYVPSELSQFLLILPITFDCPLKFRQPVILTAGRSRRTGATNMPMPETPVHKYNYFVLWQNDVWLAGQIMTMQPESKSQAMQERTHDPFWGRILASNTTHDLASFFRRKGIQWNPSSDRDL